LAKSAKFTKPPDKAVYNLDEARRDWPRIVERAAAGEEIVIAKRGRPRARLVALTLKE
jgi:prevent-host-death family protein